MRSLRKEWKNGTYPNWTKRMKWYEGESDVRICFSDQLISTNLYFVLPSHAEAAWERFKNEDVTARMIELEFADARPSD